MTCLLSENFTAVLELRIKPKQVSQIFQHRSSYSHIHHEARIPGTLNVGLAVGLNLIYDNTIKFTSYCLFTFNFPTVISFSKSKQHPSVFQISLRTSFNLTFQCLCVHFVLNTLAVLFSHFCTSNGHSTVINNGKVLRGNSNFEKHFTQPDLVGGPRAAYL